MWIMGRPKHREAAEMDSQKNHNGINKDAGESEATHINLIESLAEVIYEVHPDTLEPLYANKAIQGLFGFTPAEWLRDPGLWEQAIHPDDRENVREEIAKTLQQGENRVIEYRVLGKDKTCRWVEDHLTCVKDQNGKPVSLNGVIYDITERKLLREELRRKDQFLEAIMEHCFDGVVILNSGGTIKYQSPSVVNLIGEDRLGKNPFEFVHPDDMSDAAEAFGELLRNPGNAIRVELRGRHTDGSWHMFEAIGINHLNNPAVKSIVANLRDITQLKMVEETLKKNQEKLLITYDNVDDGIIETDLQGNAVDLNQAAVLICRLHSKDALLSKSAFELIAPRDRDKAISDINRTITEGPIKNLRYTLIDTNGNEYPGKLNATVLKNNSDDPTGFIITVRGISERTRLEEALRESEMMCNALVATSIDAIISIDKDMNVSVWNHAAEKIFGYSQREILGQSVMKIVPETHRKTMKKGFSRFLKSGTGQIVGRIVEVTGLTKEGKEVPIELSVSSRREHETYVATSIIRDISERKRMEKQVQLSGRLAAIGELAAGIAHELNNPLAAVYAYSQFLSSRQDLEESIKADVETIYTEAQRASRITSNLLDFAREHEAEKSLVSINKVIRDSLELHDYRMRVNNIEVITDLDPELPKTMADPYQMQQVLVNLITNAEQAMSEAHNQGKLHIKTQKQGDVIAISITDDGPGIDEKNRQKIFDPFFTTKGEGKGTGLGLSIVYSIINEHNGDISVESELGEGTTLRIMLPIVSRQQIAAEQKE